MRRARATFPDRGRPQANRITLFVRPPWTMPREHWADLAELMIPLAGGAGLELVVLRTLMPQPDGTLHPTVLNVDGHALLLAPGERADVIVDFATVPPGSTLILYNDCPAPLPRFDPRYDHHTGAPDRSGSGGLPPTRPGYGPNTRTLLQIRVVASLPQEPRTTSGKIRFRSLVVILVAKKRSTCRPKGGA